MKKLFSYSIAFLVVCLSLSCEEGKDCCVPPPGIEGQITGSWLLFERGYSPGSGYITEPVSENPAQTLTFRSNGQLISTVSGQEDFKYYFVDVDQKVVAFYKQDPGPTPDPSTYTTSYDFSFEEYNLRLNFRYCIEGCHMELRKVN